MNRRLLITIHLSLAAFFAPMLLMMAVTGGLYLYGIKGSVSATPITIVQAQQLPNKADDIIKTLQIWLTQNNITNTSIDSVKIVGNTIITFPSNKTYYQFKQTHQGIEIIQMQPDLLASLVAMHKGHGPSLYRYLQAAMAISLVVILLSGLLLGLQSSALKQRTIILVVLGILTAHLLAFAI